MILDGAAAVVAILVTAVLTAALADYAIRIRDPGVRLMLSLAVLTALAAGIRYFLVPALRRRWSDVEIARRLERRFPHLRDRLSSSVDFLNQPERDPTAGSAQLRRAVIAETVDEIERLTLADVIDTQRPRRMAMVAAVTVSLFALLALVNPSTARVATKRPPRSGTCIRLQVWIAASCMSTAW